MDFQDNLGNGQHTISATLNLCAGAPFDMIVGGKV